jgi:AcrR family transcriptional regulator
VATKRTARRATRRRRRPEEAESEILEAAERFLRTRAFRDLEIAELMDDTDLGRSSFYHYFRDRHELVIRLVEKLGRELLQMNAQWFESGDPKADLRAAYYEIGKFWVKHGPFLRAIADAARHDPAVEKAHRALVDRVVRGTVTRIRADLKSGRIVPLDPEDTARALILMSESFLNERLGRDPQGDWRHAIDTLATIWERTLYGI